MNKIKFILLFFIMVSLLTACGSGQTPPATKDNSKTAENAKKAVPSIHDQVSTIVQHEDMWHKEDTRTDTTVNGTYIEGPFYSLMDLDQDGYLELVVTAEKGQHHPSFYEVTEDKTLQKWTTDGDLPQPTSNFGIFETTSKTDCYYDASCDQYHYIVQDKRELSQDDAEVDWLDMTTGESGVTFKKIGRHSFSASTDNTFHYFNARGEECKEADITKDYSGMTKKTMFFSTTPISQEEAGEVWGSDMEYTLWPKFILRDAYCSEKEKTLTDEFRHEFVSHSISMTEYVFSLKGTEETDEIRYTATDLDDNQGVEVIIENETRQTYCIYEDSIDPDPDTKKWKVTGKKLSDFTKDAPTIAWQTCKAGDFKDMSYDLIEDNLRESWLRFADAKSVH